MSDTELPMVVVPPPTPPIVARPFTEIGKDLGMVQLSNAKVKALRDLSVAVEDLGIVQVIGGQMFVAQQAAVDIVLELRKLGMNDKDKLVDVAHPIGYLVNALAKSAETSKKLNVIKKAHDLDDGNRSQARVRRKKLANGPVTHIHATNAQVVMNEPKKIEEDVDQF